jgi:hypothetical protein
MEIQKTAVEWIIDRIISYDLEMIELFDGEFNQAREMEKKQLEEMYLKGLNS